MNCGSILWMGTLGDSSLGKRALSFCSVQFALQRPTAKLFCREQRPPVKRLSSDAIGSTPIFGTLIPTIHRFIPCGIFSEVYNIFMMKGKGTIAYFTNLCQYVAVPFIRSQNRFLFI